MGSNRDEERAARLEAELRANLRRRKDQARARARATASAPLEEQTAPSADAKSGASET